MKKIIFTGILLAATSLSFSQTIYTADGTLAASRTVTMAGKNLTFKSVTGNFFINGTNGFTGVNTVAPVEALDVNGNLQSKMGIFTNSQATQTFSSYVDRNYKCAVISGGTLLSAAERARTFNFYDFPQSAIDAAPTIFLDIEDRAAKTRLNFYAVQGKNSAFTLFDKNQSTNFIVSDDGADKITAIMPKTNSFLGIGTTSFTDGTDTFKLSVAGNIRANRVKVYTTWADYVFEDNYALPTLDEVEKYIKAEGHLKDIPSAKEVEEKGIELGEMNKLLLQKIEELTLYTIELNKQVQELKGQLNK
jgi:hypothetical protein